MQTQSRRLRDEDDDSDFQPRRRLNSLAIVGYVLLGLGLLVAFSCLVAIDTKKTRLGDIQYDDMSLIANKIGAVVLSVGVAIIGACWAATGIRKPLGERE